MARPLAGLECGSKDPAPESSTRSHQRPGCKSARCGEAPHWRKPPLRSSRRRVKCGTPACRYRNQSPDQKYRQISLPRWDLLDHAGLSERNQIAKPFRPTQGRREGHHCQRGGRSAVDIASREHGTKLACRQPRLKHRQVYRTPHRLQKRPMCTEAV